MYTCDPAGSSSRNPLGVDVKSSQSAIVVGEKVTTSAMVSGGTPPYRYEWFDGRRKSNANTPNVVWQNAGMGTHDLKVVVTDASGSSAEAHARITVRAAGESAASSGPKSPPSTLPASPSSGPVNMAGTWQPGARGETWTFRALGNNLYEAVGRGSSNAVGVATVIGNWFRLDYTWQDGGKHWGYYQMTVEPGGSKAAGRFHDDRPQEGTVSMTRTAGP
jgi:hypothetical protein